MGKTPRTRSAHSRSQPYFRGGWQHGVTPPAMYGYGASPASFGSMSQQMFYGPPQYYNSPAPGSAGFGRRGRGRTGPNSRGRNYHRQEYSSYNSTVQYKQYNTGSSQKKKTTFERNVSARASRGKYPSSVKTSQQNVNSPKSLSSNLQTKKPLAQKKESPNKIASKKSPAKNTKPPSSKTISSKSPISPKNLKSPRSSASIKSSTPKAASGNPSPRSAKSSPARQTRSSTQKPVPSSKSSPDKSPKSTKPSSTKDASPSKLSKEKSPNKRRSVSGEKSTNKRVKSKSPSPKSAKKRVKSRSPSPKHSPSGKGSRSPSKQKLQNKSKSTPTRASLSKPSSPVQKQTSKSPNPTSKLRTRTRSAVVQNQKSKPQTKAVSSKGSPQTQSQRAQSSSPATFKKSSVSKAVTKRRSLLRATTSAKDLGKVAKQKSSPKLSRKSLSTVPVVSLSRISLPKSSPSISETKSTNVRSKASPASASRTPKSTTGTSPRSASKSRLSTQRSRNLETAFKNVQPDTLFSKQRISSPRASQGIAPRESLLTRRKDRSDLNVPLSPHKITEYFLIDETDSSVRATINNESEDQLRETFHNSEKKPMNKSVRLDSVLTPRVSSYRKTPVPDKLRRSSALEESKQQSSHPETPASLLVSGMKRNINSILSSDESTKKFRYTDSAPGPSTSNSDSDSSLYISSADEVEEEEPVARNLRRRQSERKTVSVTKSAYSRTTLSERVPYAEDSLISSDADYEPTPGLLNGDEEAGGSQQDYGSMNELNDTKSQRMWCSVM